MNRTLFRIGILSLVAAFAGCQKKPDAAPATQAAPAAATPSAAPKSGAIDMVKETEQSASFLAVSKQLELGGTLYTYIDINGDVKKFGDSLKNVVTRMAEVQPQLGMVADQDFSAIFGMLGFSDVKAVGLSSVPEGDGFFRNRMFFYAPGERHGFMAAFGGKPAPFKNLRMAPADADVYVEEEFDVPVVYEAVKQVIGKVAGDAAKSLVESQLKSAGDQIGVSILDAIKGLKGRTTVIARVDPTKTMAIPLPPQGFSIPQFSMMCSIEGIGAVLEGAIAKLPMLKMTKVGTMNLYSIPEQSPVPGLQPVLAVEGTTLYFSTNEQFLRECFDRKSGLDQVPEFKKALAALGTEGNGLSYMSPNLFTRIRQLSEMNPGVDVQTRQTLRMMSDMIPAPKQALITVRSNLPDGIVIRSHWYSSLKTTIMAAAIYNPMTIGLMAAMAIPAFQKVRTSSQEKAVLNNLRQLAAAADQYKLENGTNTVTYNNLVGPNKFIRAINSVAGEDYRGIQFIAGQPLKVTLPSGQVVSYDW